VFCGTRKNTNTYLTRQAIVRVVRGSLELDGAVELGSFWIRMMAYVGAVCASQGRRDIVNITAADSEDGLLA
jgi:hypothetical protein